jgi:proline iminopeptidase
MSLVLVEALYVGSHLSIAFSNCRSILDKMKSQLKLSCGSQPILSQSCHSAMRTLYPAIAPYQTGTLSVSKLHTLYFEQVGNPSGKPAIFLHGGPGGGIDPIYRQYFNPEVWRVVLFDQRGCGQSTPHAELQENTTWELVNDIEQLRLHLGIDRWTVFGGSWGSTLALAYSQTHPASCTGLILRGIFLLRQKELRWFYQEGASNLFPDAWEAYLHPIPPAERDDLIAAYYRRLTSPDRLVRAEAARAWSVWEASTSKLIPDPSLTQKFGEGHFADAFARIECHYFVNRGFFTQEDQLLENCDRIRHLPTVIVQGRYDVVCPMVSAWELHQQLPEASLIVVPDAGHSMTEPGIRQALLDASDRFALLD